MSVRQGSVARGLARGRAIVTELCRELERNRLEIGLSYSDLGRAVGLSGQQAARICREESTSVSIVRLAGLLAAVGLDLTSRAYPGGPPIRDAAHVALLRRLQSRLSDGLTWRAEVPVVTSGVTRDSTGRPLPIDKRAWDAVIEGSGWRFGVEAETRLGDVQALERRIALKERDGGVNGVLLLLNDTVHNHRVLRLDGVSLGERLSGSARQTLKRLGNGLPPLSSTVIVL